MPGPERVVHHVFVTAVEASCRGQARDHLPEKPRLLAAWDPCDSEAGSYLRLIDFVYHSTPGLRVKKKKKIPVECGLFQVAR